MKPKQQKAFTLIELLVVIAIIGILSTLAVVSLQNARKSARDAKRVSDIKQIQTALELYYNYKGKYPNSIPEDLATYLPNFPQAPTPADGDCNQENNEYIYQQENNGSNYSLTFCLGSKTGELDEGPKTAGVGGISGSSSAASFHCGENIIDTRDQNIYPTIKIGSQCWMAKNLAYLPAVFELSVESETDPKYYVYGYNGTDVAAAKATANYITYGVLYNFSVVDPETNHEEVCPTGWHVPTDGEWTTLTSYLGGELVAGGKMKATGTTYWKSPNTGATNEYGFTALPAGGRFGGVFHDLFFYTYWWSSSPSGDYAQRRYINYYWEEVDGGDSLRSNAYSLRCFRTDND